MFLAHPQSRALRPAYRGALVIGVVLARGPGCRRARAPADRSAGPRDDLHFLYGASVILTLPLVASYIADKKVSRALAYGLASLFMAGSGDAGV